METKYVFALVVGVIVLLGVFYGLRSENSTVLPAVSAYGPKDDAGATGASVSALSEGINMFGVDLLREINAPQNVVISPVSVEFALAIAAEGARDRTLDEMLSTLHLPKAATVRRPAFARIYNAMNRDGNVVVELANAIWIRPGFTPNREYLSIVQRYYPADVYSTVDPVQINAWVSRRTHGKITRIVNTVSPDVEMLIVNAVYFHGRWRRAFNPSATTRMLFHAPSGDVNVMAMTDTRQLLYYRDMNAQAVILPYSDGNFVAVVVLPQHSISSYLSHFSGETVSTILHFAHMAKVRLYIPKFKLETDYTLNRYLSKMGMRRAFIRGVADFSGIAGNPGSLYIGDVVHKVYLRVDESGTEAAAATSVGIIATAAPGGSLGVQIFRVDRPFLFFVVDRTTGVVLFEAKISNPSAG